jgi:hypothetical protein
MTWSINTFVQARDTVAKLLTDLGLQNYRFDVEPQDDGWQVRLEYAADAAWREATLRIDQRGLEKAVRDSAARREIVAQWKEQLRSAGFE